jgi:hypothetical protein
MEVTTMKGEIEARIGTTRKALEDQLEALCALLQKRPHVLTSEARLPELELQLGDGIRLVRELLTLHRVARAES